MSSIILVQNHIEIQKYYNQEGNKKGIEKGISQMHNKW